MILATTASSIEGYQIVAFKGTAQSATFEGLLSKTEDLGANAVLNVCYDNTLSADTLFHGSAVVAEPVPPYRLIADRGNCLPLQFQLQVLKQMEKSDEPR